MEQNFQTSFIPKKPIVKKRVSSSRPVGLLTVLSIFIFFTVLLASAGLYFYKGVVEKNINAMENNLNIAKNRFEPSKIAELELLGKRLKASNDILSGHVAVTPIFEVLQLITMKTVRYLDFDYNFDSKEGSNVVVKMNGMADGYRSVALQSDLFAKNKNLIEPIFSNLTLDDDGNVLFDLEFSVDPTFVNYKHLLSVEN
jgi:hypothetical protein